MVEDGVGVGMKEGHDRKLEMVMEGFDYLDYREWEDLWSYPAWLLLCSYIKTRNLCRIEKCTGSQ